MKLRSTVIVVAAVAMAAMLQTAHASMSLAAFEAGGTLTAGGLTFTGSGPFGGDESGLTGFNVNVDAYESGGIVYLSWGGNIALSSTGPSSADLILQYTVRGGPVGMIDQTYTGSAQGGNLSVVETVATGGFGGTTVASSTLNGIGDNSDPPENAFDVVGDDLYLVPPQSSLYVTKDINFGITSLTGGLITISAVTQSFHAVPEPSTVIAGALLVLPFGVSALRILRRNRIG
ncbi:MAG TPA: hypothetical protein VMH87_03390 [Pseudomonadales bacterium]|nr:hypothetical protein [Pseudomonadales bacterium]